MSISFIELAFIQSGSKKYTDEQIAILKEQMNGLEKITNKSNEIGDVPSNVKYTTEAAVAKYVEEHGGGGGGITEIYKMHFSCTMDPQTTSYVITFTEPQATVVSALELMRTTNAEVILIRDNNIASWYRTESIYLESDSIVDVILSSKNFTDETKIKISYNLNAADPDFRVLEYSSMSPTSQYATDTNYGIVKGDGVTIHMDNGTATVKAVGVELLHTNTANLVLNGGKANQ